MGRERQVRAGMTVYGLMNSADGYFEAEGIVYEVDEEGFRVAYRVLPGGKRYRYTDIGRKVYFDSEEGEEEETEGKEMNGTNVVCGVKECRYCKLDGCKRKAVVLDKEGNCLNKETVDGKGVPEKAAGAARDAAEGVLMYGA